MSDITTSKDLDYNSKVDVEDMAGNDDIVATNVVKRGITRLHKFHNEHGKELNIPLCNVPKSKTKKFCF